MKDAGQRQACVRFVELWKKGWLFDRYPGPPVSWVAHLGVGTAEIVPVARQQRRHQTGAFVSLRELRLDHRSLEALVKAGAIHLGKRPELPLDVRRGDPATIALTLAQEYGVR